MTLRVALVALLALVGGLHAAPPDVRELVAAWPPPCPPFDADDDSWSARELIACAEDRRRRLPRVPFFVYDGEWMPPKHSAAEELRRAERCVASVRTGDQFTADVHFLRQLLTHPWRVREPERALLLVPPLFLSTAQSGECKSYAQRQARLVLRHVLASPLFAARRADHLFVAPHWRHLHSPVLRPPAGSVWGWYMAPRGRALRPRGNTSQYTMVAVPVVLPDPLIPARVARHAARPLALLFAGGASERPGGYVSVRRPLARALQSPGSGAQPAGGAAGAAWGALLRTGGALLVMSGMDGLPRCANTTDDLLAAAMAAAARAPPAAHVCDGRASAMQLGLRARFMLYLRGDTSQTQRFQDCAATGALPVLISDGAWAESVPFQPAVPYRQFSLSLPEAEALADAPRALGALLARTHERRAARMRELLLHFRRDLLWDYRADAGGAGGAAGPASRVAENVLLRAALALGERAAARDAAAHAAAAGPRGAGAAQAPRAGAVRRSCCSWFGLDLQG